MKIHLNRSGHIPRITDQTALSFKALEPTGIFLILSLIWFTLPQVLQGNNPNLGMVDQSLWVLVVLSMISFMLICALSWWLLKHFWTALGLPEIHTMVSHFNKLSSWQQLSFYWGSFALLLLVATACLVAVC